MDQDKNFLLDPIGGDIGDDDLGFGFDDAVDEDPGEEIGPKKKSPRTRRRSAAIDQRSLQHVYRRAFSETQLLDILPLDSPILFSFTSDAYQPLDVDTGATREAIRILKEADQHIVVLTKGGTRATRDFDLLGEGDFHGATLTFLDAEESKKWEPGAATPEDRIEALRLAKEHGIGTWVSLEPVISPEQSLAAIDRVAPFVDLFKVGKLNYHPRADEIDWHAFAVEAVRRIRATGKKMYIKKDLRQYLEREKCQTKSFRSA